MNENIIKNKVEEHNNLYINNNNITELNEKTNDIQPAQKIIKKIISSSNKKSLEKNFKENLNTFETKKLYMNKNILKIEPMHLNIYEREKKNISSKNNSIKKKKERRRGKIKERRRRKIKKRRRRKIKEGKGKEK